MATERTRALSTPADDDASPVDTGGIAISARGERTITGTDNRLDVAVTGRHGGRVS